MEAKLRRTEIMSMCQYIGGQTACLGAEGKKSHGILTEMVDFWKIKFVNFIVSKT